MTYSFNLLHEPWIPCLCQAGARKTFSLKDTIFKSPEVIAIIHPSPLVTIALHRLLLAVLHRNCGPQDAPGGPRNMSEWVDIWTKRKWDMERLDCYFEKWSDRFDLFHEQHPFYQTPEISLSEKKMTTAGLLALSPPYRSHPTLFDHGIVEVTPHLSPGEAAQLLVAQQAFAYVNLVTYDDANDKSARAAPLVRSVVVLNKGNDLFETLMLNLLAYNPEDEEPFPFDRNKDIPAWEHSEHTRPLARSPHGYLDWLTWQSRRIRLKPSVKENGEVGVSNFALMKGCQLPKGNSPKNYETMVPYRSVENAKKDQAPWVPVGFSENRSLWRDSMALLHSESNNTIRPRTADWISDLNLAGVIQDNAKVDLEVFGLSADQAKPEFWRRESLPIHSRYYCDKELIGQLGQALLLAQDVGDTISAKVKLRVRMKGGGSKQIWLWELGYALMLPDEPEELTERQVEQIGGLERHVAPERTYWPRIENPFKKLLVDLPGDASTDRNGSIVYGANCCLVWARVIEKAAWEAFRMAAASVGESARALKARAKAEHVFRRRLTGILNLYMHSGKEGGGAS